MLDTAVCRQTHEDIFRFQNMLGKTLDMVFIFEPDTLRFVYLNYGAVLNTGYTEEELLGLTPCQLHPLLPESEFRQFIAPLLANKQSSLRFETTIRHKDGTDLCADILVQFVTEPDGNGAFVAIARKVCNRDLRDEAPRTSDIRFRAVFEYSRVGINIQDTKSRFLKVNQAFVEMTGYSEEELLRCSFKEITHPDEVESCNALAKSLLAEEIDHFQAEKKYLRKDGSILWANVTVSPERDHAGKIIYFIAILQDITARKKAEEALQLAAMVYRHSSESMMVTDNKCDIVSVNRAFTEVTGYSLEEVVGKNPRMLRSDRQSRDFYAVMWRELNSTGHWQGEIWNRRKNGELYLEWITINTIYNDDNSVHRYVGLFSDITKKKVSEELIWQQANFDTLTGLPNRHMFHARLNMEIKKIRSDNSSIALLFIDLDNFKEVNDSLGHNTGDILLIEAARRIKDCVRETDIVARIGGDEFTVIVTGLNDIGSVERMAQNILSKMTAPFQLGEEKSFVSASIGITRYPEDATNAEALLKNADQAMYAAKAQGRNSYCNFTLAMQKTAKIKRRMVNELRDALVAQQFRVFYQPIVTLQNGALHKAEALIRWQHPVRGLISPAEFIPVAEETGMITAIGDWVFREVAQQVAYWRSACYAKFQISINVSPVQFRQYGANFEEWFNYLKELGLSGQSIVVEITEGLLLDANSSVASQLLAFRDAGIRVSLDDFGTGYSSLSYLKKFDIDYLKIDQSFVRDLASDPNDMVLCEAIIVMAHKLGLKVIAEGIETEQQRALLTAVGCDYGQGYLFSTPIPADEFELQLKAKTFQ